MSNTQSLVTGEFTASAVLADCEVVKKRKLEVQLSSPADLVKMFGPRALDESQASVPLNKLSARSDDETQATRDGAPEGPSRRQGKYNDGSEPLAHSGFEAVAEYLSTPKSIREVKSVTALAAQLRVARLTVYRWTKNREVLRRAKWLTSGDVKLGAIIARRELPEIVEMMAAKAKSGDVRAAKLLFQVAVDLESRLLANSGHISSLTINEALAMTEDSVVEPSGWNDIDEGQ